MIQTGFILSYNEKSTKNANSEIFFDLVARGNNQMIVMVILSSDLKYNIELLYHIELFRSEQVNFNPLVTSLEEPSQLIFNLLSKFNINLIISNDENEILSRFQNYLS